MKSRRKWRSHVMRYLKKMHESGVYHCPDAETMNIEQLQEQLKRFSSLFGTYIFDNNKFLQYLKSLTPNT